MAMNDNIRFDKEAYSQKLIEHGYTPEQAMTIADQYDKAQQSRPKVVALKNPDKPAPISKRLSDYLAQEEEDAGKSGAIGYLCRALVQASLPHSKPQGNEFRRHNGNFELAMWSPTGLPYGTVPRLIVSWMTTEAVRTKSRVLTLGASLSDFLENLGFIRAGGARGDITRVKAQMKRLLSSAITCTYDNGKSFAVRHVSPIESASLWWDPVDPSQISLWESTLTLNASFYAEVTTSPIPLRLATLKALRNSAMALDIYAWLTYRNSYAHRPSRIPWEALQMQFGSSYPSTTRGKLDFKRKFLLALKKVGVAYPEAQKLQAETDALIYVPGYPDVSPIAPKR